MKVPDRLLEHNNNRLHPCTAERDPRIRVSFVSYPTSLQPGDDTFLGPSVNQFRSIFNATVALEMFIFDSFATIVKALDSYEKIYRSLCAVNASYCLENFNYDSSEISDRLDRELLKTDFLGKQH